MEFRAAKGRRPVQPHVEGREVVFDPLPKLAPRADVIYRVSVRCVAAGDLRFQARMRADGLTGRCSGRRAPASTATSGKDLHPSKSEARNPKTETNRKSENRTSQTGSVARLGFLLFLDPKPELGIEGARGCVRGVGLRNRVCSERAFFSGSQPGGAL